MPRRQSKGRKRHVPGRYTGLPIRPVVHAADVQDRDGGLLLVGSLFRLKLHVDSGDQAPKVRNGLSRMGRQLNVEIVKRSDAGQSVICPSARLSNGPLPGPPDAAAWQTTGSA